MKKSLESAQTLGELIALTYAGFASIVALIAFGFMVAYS